MANSVAPRPAPALSSRRWRLACAGSSSRIADRYAVTGRARRDGPGGPRSRGPAAWLLRRDRVGKSYVSYYLMAVYALPDLVEAMSPQLRRRMQGKACFNFTRVDDALMIELAEVTARGAQRWGPNGPPA